MSLQAEYSVQLLMQFYAEFDQHSGWADYDKLIAYQTKQGVASGRTESALMTLKALKMVDERVQDGRVELKISNYGVVWFERNFTLVSRGKSYEYEYSAFRRIRLMGPDEFYKTRKDKSVPGNPNLDWAKWGVIIGAIIGAAGIAVAKGWL